jgi:hypothetical protein
MRVCIAVHTNLPVAILVEPLLKQALIQSHRLTSAEVDLLHEIAQHHSLDAHHQV